MEKITKLVFLILPLFLIGCSTMKVEPVSSEHKISRICIEKNPAVIVHGFLPIIESRFKKHGIDSLVYKNKKPKSCAFNLTYTAFQAWDITLFLTHAELHLYKSDEKIGYGEYHLTGKGGFDFSKWNSVETKMNPVIDKLLEEYEIQEY